MPDPTAIPDDDELDAPLPVLPPLVERLGFDLVILQVAAGRSSRSGVLAPIAGIPDPDRAQHILLRNVARYEPNPNTSSDNPTAVWLVGAAEPIYVMATCDDIDQAIAYPVEEIRAAESDPAVSDSFTH